MLATVKKLALTLAAFMALFALAAPAFAQTGGAFTDPPKNFPLVTGWFQGRLTHYFDFGMTSPIDKNTGKVVPAPIYVLITGMDAQGNPIMVPGQRNIIDVVPGDPGYSDLWAVGLVTVPADYVANTFKSADDVMKSGYKVAYPGLLVNCPVVPLNSTLAENSPATNTTTPVKGWYKGREVHYFDFGPNTADTAPIYALITGFDAQGNPMFVEGQHNIIDVIPGSTGYSAFWDVNLVEVPAGYVANTITSRAQVMASGYKMVHPGIVVNCPLVRTDDAVTGNMANTNSMVGMPNTGGASSADMLLWATLGAATLVASGLVLQRRVAHAKVKAE